MYNVPSAFDTPSSVYDPFSSDQVWDPFPAPINWVFRPTRRVAEDASAVADARINWKETPEAHVITAELPGVKKEGVKVEVEDGRILKIGGERSKEEEQKTDKWHRIERSHGKFERRLRLPDNVKVDELKATLENGVLTVTVPKRSEQKPRVKKIEISAAG